MEWTGFTWILVIMVLVILTGLKLDSLALVGGGICGLAGLLWYTEQKLGWLAKAWHWIVDHN